MISDRADTPSAVRSISFWSFFPTFQTEMPSGVRLQVHLLSVARRAAV